MSDRTRSASSSDEQSNAGTNPAAGSAGVYVALPDAFLGQIGLPAGQPIPFGPAAGPAAGPFTFPVPGVPIPFGPWSAMRDQPAARVVEVVPPADVREEGSWSDSDSDSMAASDEAPVAVPVPVRQRPINPETGYYDSELSEDEEPERVVDDPITDVSFWPELREMLTVSDEEKARIVAEGGVLPWDRLQLECSICYAKMSTPRDRTSALPPAKHEARIGVCGHIFCHHCLDKTFQARRHREFACPGCRKSWSHSCGHPNMGLPIPYRYDAGRDFMPKVVTEGGKLSDECDECVLRTAMDDALNLILNCVKQHKLNLGPDPIGVRYFMGGRNHHLAKFPDANNRNQLRRHRCLGDSGPFPRIVLTMVKEFAEGAREEAKKGWGQAQHWDAMFELWQYSVVPEGDTLLSKELENSDGFYEQIDEDSDDDGDE